MIISLEGGEGAGKSTQACLLAEYLGERGLAVLSFREPGGTPFSEEIRGLFLKQELDPLTELLLVLAARRRNLIELINPALKRGDWVIIDRFIDSTLVYQGLVGGLGLDQTRTLMQASGTWTVPDLTLVLDMDPSRALTRIDPSRRSRFDRQESSFHLRVREGFVQLARERRHRIIDAVRPVPEVAQAIRSIVQEVLA